MLTFFCYLCIAHMLLYGKISTKIPPLQTVAVFFFVQILIYNHYKLRKYFNNSFALG